MDYFVFLTGLFLLTSGLGCLFLFREDRRFSRWPMLTAALAAFGLRTWIDLLTFAIGPVEALSLVSALLGAVFATCLLCFLLSPLIDGKTSSFVLKWAAIVALFGVTFISGAGSLKSPAFVAPILIAAFAGGWRVSGFGRELLGARRMTHPLATALLLTVIVAVCLLPEAVDVSYDVKGQANSPARITFLAALATASASSNVFCLILWSAIYQANHGTFSRNLLRRRRIGTSVILAAAVFTLANGAWLAHWLGNQARQEQTSTLLSALHLGAQNFDVSRINQIQGNPDEVGGEPYTILRSKLLQIREALPGTRFAYILGLRNEKLVFLVDAEDPGRVDTFSPPGEPVKDYPERWLPELAGNSTFTGPDLDDWGVWYSASVPIFDQGDNVTALLGVDFPAAMWLRPLAARRGAAMGVTLSVGLLLIALFSFHMVSSETARHVESLSERLSDAMIAAEFDTWECFPKPFNLNVGERIATTLGWAGANSNPSFRKVWRSIHPEDRSQLFNLIRQQGSSEAEIRLKDSDGHWLWFMLRGRIVYAQAEEDAIRMVGTILNIDERHRSRLELDKQRRFAQHVMESVPNGLAVIDAAGAISYANPAFIRLAHGGSHTLTGKPLDALIANCDPTNNADEGFEANLACIDGASVPVKVFRAPLSEAGQNAGYILAVVDLTTSKEAEQDLLRSRAEANRLALVAKRTDNAVVITDSVGRIEWVNEGFTRISGYRKEEVMGKTPGSMLQRLDNMDPSRLYMRACIKAGKGFETELLNYGKGGRSYLVHIECQPLVDRHGTLTGFMAIERDITQARRSSNLLEAVASISTTLLSKRIEPAVFGEILSALGTAANADRCYIFKAHSHPTLGTPAISQCGEWTSRSSKSQLANPKLQNFPLHESGYGRWYQELQAGHQISGLAGDFPIEEQPMLVAQEIRSLVVVPIFTGDSLWGFLGFDACHEDRVWEDWEISILRSAAANLGLRQVAQNEADALVLARDEAHTAALAAEKANQAKSTFLATMSHEIRTPLNAVIGMASLLETTSLNAQQQDFAEAILGSGNFLLDLINDILDYSRIETSSIELDSSPFALADVCREAFDVVRPGAMGKQLELIARIAPHLPNEVTGDRARIRQILVNLISNAVKFTPSGFVSLAVDGKPASGDRWDISFEVKDSGIGISPDAIKRLFNPFVQEDSSTTRRFGGSGLGLAISKRLAELMDGDITVHSTQGKGSTFLATLSISASGRTGIMESPITTTPGGTLPTILIVDDDELNRRILEETLAGWGLPCQPAASAFEAIEQWTLAGPFDLVIADHHMPEMDGIEMTRYLRSLPDSANTRFSLISSENNQSAEIRNLFDSVGPKPIWPSTIHGILTRLFPGTITETPNPSKSTGEFESEQLGQLKVLVAEDNINNQKVIRLLLRRLGIEANIVSNGLEAVEAVRAAPYDIIFLDVQMPVMDGLEASRAIRDIACEKRPFVIALTANVFQEDRDAAADAGMDEYMSKPITLGRLREMLSMIVNSTSPEKPPVQESKRESEPGLLDHKVLDSLACVGRESYLELLGDITLTTEEYLETIRSAIQGGDTKALREILHKLRGMLLQFGFVAMPSLIGDLEVRYESIHPDQSSAIQTRLQALWEASLEAIRQWEKTVPELQPSGTKQPAMSSD